MLKYCKPPPNPQNDTSSNLTYLADTGWMLNLLIGAGATVLLSANSSSRTRVHELFKSKLTYILKDFVPLSFAMVLCVLTRCILLIVFELIFRINPPPVMWSGASQKLPTTSVFFIETDFHSLFIEYREGFNFPF